MGFICYIMLTLEPPYGQRTQGDVIPYFTFLKSFLIYPLQIIITTLRNNNENN